MSDVSIPITDSDLSTIDQVSDIVNRAIGQNDPSVAFAYARTWNKTFILRGVALAKLFYELKQRWVWDVDFYQAVRSEVGIQTDTVNKYLTMYEALFTDPKMSDEMRRKLIGKGIEQLLMLPAVWRESSNEDKEALANTATRSELREKVRELRGVATSSETAIIVRYHILDGRIDCKQGTTGDWKVIGFLKNTDDDPVVKRAIERLTEKCMVV